MTNPVASAKEFLIDRVLDQAKKERVELSDVEIRMLGFSESGAKAKDMEAAASFDRDFDDAEYEAKVADLLKTVYERDTQAGLKEKWNQSLDALEQEDCYLLVMLERAGLVETTMSLRLPDWRLLWGLVPAAVCLGLAILVAEWSWSEKLIPNSSVRLGVAVLLLVAPVIWSRLRR